MSLVLSHALNRPIGSGTARRSCASLKIVWTALIVGVPLGLPSGAQVTTSHPVRFSDLGGFTRAENLQLSPDGKLLAYVTVTDSEPLDGTVWVAETRRGRTPRRVAEGFLPQWSPDGRKLAYYHHQAKVLQLWILDVAANQTEVVTRLEGGIDPDPATYLGGWIWDPFRYSWSPDGRQIVFASRAPIKERPAVRSERQSIAAVRTRESGAPLVLDASTPPDLTIRGIFTHGFGEARWKNGTFVYENAPNLNLSPASVRVNQLFILTLNGKQVRQLTRDDSGYFDPDWSPDGKAIVCASNEARMLGGFGDIVTNLYALSPVDGRKTVLTSGPGAKWMPEWSPDGAKIAFLANERSGTTSLLITPGQGGRPVNATARLDRSVMESHWVSGHGSVIVSYVDGVSWSIARIDLASGQIEPLSGQQGAFRGSVTVASAGSLAWAEDNPGTPGEIQLLSVGALGPSVLRNLNPQTSLFALGKQEILRWRNHHGDELEGLLIKPPNYQQGRRYPLIVDAMPRQPNTFKGYPMLGNQAWASNGYVVFWPNARTPTEWEDPFKSREYDQAAKGPKGWDVTVDDVMSGVDELIRHQIVDSDRMCLYGFSNGAGIVNYLVTRTDRFKCAVSVSGLSDWMSLPLLTGDPQRLVEGMLGNGATPWENPDDYVEVSAVFHLKSVVTPMLLAAGDEEDGFLLNTIEMFSGLRRLGKDVTLLRYPNQDHGFTGAALADFGAREATFFAKYLKPDSMLSQ
jgi:dipeptidyl aminopeptidase/acylaminoacyl peptidase